MNEINHTLRDPNQPVAVPVPAATVLLVRDTDEGLQVFLMQTLLVVSPLQMIWVMI